MFDDCVFIMEDFTKKDLNFQTKKAPVLKTGADIQNLLYLCLKYRALKGGRVTSSVYGFA